MPIRVAVPNTHAGENHLGGGWSFIRNLREGSTELDIIETKDWVPCDAVLIASATMSDKNLVQEYKDQGKKIILRIDNLPRESRNRGTAFSRLKKFYDLADVVVYQSEWAKDYLDRVLGGNKPTKVILNGANQEIFKTEGLKQQRPGKDWLFLYSRHNRDENKRWEEALYEYQNYHIDRDGEATLWICGQFSSEQVQYNFDFVNNEKVFYWGDVKDRELMASIYRSVDIMLMPYYNDACSNTLIEARCCGVPVIVQNNTGGNEEIMKAELDYLSHLRMAKDYEKLFK